MIDKLKIKKLPCWLVITEDYWFKIYYSEKKALDAKQGFEEGRTQADVIKLEKDEEKE